MTALTFVDTETTSLRPDRRAWEVAIVCCDEHGEIEYSWFVRLDDLDLGNADPKSLEVGGFYTRHPDITGSGSIAALPERDVLTEAEDLTRGTHLVGAVPSFDAETLATRMRANGICPSWHHRLRCVESLAAGYLRRRDIGGLRDAAEALGVETWAAHTALGDARTARAVWEAVMAGDPS